MFSIIKKPIYQRWPLFLCAFLIASTVVYAQTSDFPGMWVGTWKGKMYRYAQGQLRDSVQVEMHINPLEEPNTWQWKTTYLSPQNTVIKDYVLKSVEATKGHFRVDEGDGIILDAFFLGGKLFHLFDVKGLYLTATYEMREDKLLFEVTSGKRLNTTGSDVTNYSVENLQRSLLQRYND